jgi:lipopolysaccharide transport system ATP-binding protein
MPVDAIRIEGLGKRYELGATLEGSLAERLGAVASRLVGRRAEDRAKSHFWALRDIDLRVPEGESLGVVGGNGAGKSTLLKILSRITEPTTGRAMVRGRLSSLLEVGTGFHPELTGRENVFLNGTILGMRRAEIARKFDEIVAFSGIEKFIDTPVKRYSSGMYVRLAFAVAAHLEPDVLIIDEVLAVGDADFQKRCLGKLGDVARQGRTVLFVSHNMAAIQKLCSSAIWLQEGRIVASGEPADVVSRYIDQSGLVDASGEGLPPGLLYRNKGEAGQWEACVDSISILDGSGLPLRTVQTWGDLRLRVKFSVERPFRSFSVVLSISTPDGVSLILTSTQPDHDVGFSAEPGRYSVDCVFEQLPLAAGEYVLGAGLAIPGIEYTWRNDSLARVRVEPRDVYDSGLPPASDRYLVASRHRWQQPVRLA